MSTFTPYMHPKDELLATMGRIYQYRMTTTSGGNLSIREENGDIWITPTRVDKGTLRREDMVWVGKNGEVKGLHPPSSELPLHQEIYRARPDLHGLVHAHPVALVAFRTPASSPRPSRFAVKRCLLPMNFPAAWNWGRPRRESSSKGATASSWKITVW